MGRKSVEIQSENRRSKNEIYFANLCKKHFSNILTNKSIFNGWDADVILVDEKIAVLWNGVWHYKTICKEMPVEKTQARDKIKLTEIIKCGYVPYIIRDMGHANKEFVESEFNKFKQFLERRLTNDLTLI